MLNRAVVGDPRGHTKDHFDILEGNQFETFSPAKVICCYTMRLRLPELVITELFLQARRYGHHWRDPMRLLILYPRHAGKPVREVLLNAEASEGRPAPTRATS
jgi:hypothetical protein